MEPDRQDIAATYEVRREEKETSSRVGAIVMGVIIAGIVASITIATLGVLQANGKSNAQGAQIHALNVANKRLANEVAADGNRLSQMSVKLTQLSAKLTAADPASDSSLITCNDLRRLNLTTTTGGSVSAVPGSVSLNQSAVSLPAHCAKR